MMEDIETQNHAYIIAREYNLADVVKLKTERISTRGTAISSVWLATKDRCIRSFAQYNQDWLIGKPCSYCWGEDKVFGDRLTPNVVTVSLQNIRACPGYEPAPDGSFVEFVNGQIHIYPLVQDFDVPCHFFRQVPNWLNSETLNIHWWAVTDTESELLIDLQPSGSIYFQQNSSPCSVFFENSLAECDAPAIIGFGGTGRIIF